MGKVFYECGINMVQKLVFFGMILFVLLSISVGCLASEKLNVLVVALDLKGSPLSSDEYLNIVSAEIVARLSSSEVIGDVKLVIPNGFEGPLDLQEIGRKEAADVVFLVNIGRGRVGPNIGTHEKIEEGKPGATGAGEFGSIINRPMYASTYVPEKNYHALFKAVSVASGRVWVYSKVDETYNDVFQEALGKYFSDLAKNFPGKKGRVVGIKKNSVEINLGASDNLVPGDVVFLFPTTTELGMKGMFPFLGGQMGIEKMVYEAGDTYSVLGASNSTNEAAIKEGWIVEAYVKSKVTSSEAGTIEAK